MLTTPFDTWGVEKPQLRECFVDCNKLQYLPLCAHPLEIAICCKAVVAASCVPCYAQYCAGMLTMS